MFSYFPMLSFLRVFQANNSPMILTNAIFFIVSCEMAITSPAVNYAENIHY